MRNSRFCAAILLLLLSLSSSCRRLPHPREDVRIGREVADAMEAQIGRYPDADLENYVSSVASRVEGLIVESPFKYSYKILDQPEPNAFAAPGGYVYVSRRSPRSLRKRG